MAQRPPSHPAHATVSSHSSRSTDATSASSRSSSEEDVTTPLEDEMAMLERFREAFINDPLNQNGLIGELMRRYFHALHFHRYFVTTHLHEMAALQTNHANVLVAQLGMDRLQSILNRVPFILVLIDADIPIFTDRLIQKGEEGGREAAATMSHLVSQWAAANIRDCPANMPVMLRIFADFSLWAATCRRAGIIDTTARIDDFARGFTQGQALSDFTNVGPDRDNAEKKMTDMFNLYAINYHCRAIMLGGSHDGRTVRMMHPHSRDAEAISRVTLLEGVPMGDLHATLPSFAKVKLTGLFRETLIPTTVPPMAEIPRRSSQAASSSRASATTLAATLRALHLREDSVAASSSSGTTPNTQAFNNGSENAGRSTAPRTSRVRGPRPISPITFEKAPTTILRNRYAQRLDTPRPYDRDEILRIKALRLCNQHYIGGGCCHYNAGRADKCPHTHRTQLTARDRGWVRAVARETPCKRGHMCDEAKCIYGHQCPWPRASNEDARAFPCSLAASCRFQRSMHDMDEFAVELTHVR